MGGEYLLEAAGFLDLPKVALSIIEPLADGSSLSLFRKICESVS